ncbi:uncharacterized protein LOC142525461 isoform X2 [Primulina tabacum]|uniref:uncharacterized protein LOC142525461 isoform X2 n=1 Tax=Primulina tabacum TaxID=48773 RepID=UPI003F5A66B3
MIGYGRPPQHTVALDLNLADVQKKRLLLWIMGTRKRAMSPEVEDGEIVATGRVMSVKIYTGVPASGTKNGCGTSGGVAQHTRAQFTL